MSADIKDQDFEAVNQKYIFCLGMQRLVVAWPDEVGTDELIGRGSVSRMFGMGECFDRRGWLARGG